MPMKVMSAGDRKRVVEINKEVGLLSSELRRIVKPTKVEIADLLQDVQMNPEVYTSYFVDDDLFLSENVYYEREAQGKEDDNGDLHYVEDEE